MLRNILSSICICLLSLSRVAVSAPTSKFEVIEHLNGVPAGWTQDGAADPSAMLKFRVALVQHAAVAFERAVLDMSTPGHATYGQHMKRDEVNKFLQPSEDVLQSVLDWLGAEGIKQSSVKADADWLSLVITIQQAEKILNTRFYNFKNTVDGSRAIRTLQYSVPSSVAQYIHMIQPTTKFNNPNPYVNSVFVSNPLSGASKPVQDCNHVITIDCLRRLYKMGDAVAVKDPRNKLGISGFLEQYARLDDFDQFISYSAPEMVGASFEVKSINGGLNLQNSSHDSIEASLDVDYAIGLSNASSVFYTTGGRGPIIPDLDQPDPNKAQNEPYMEQLHYFLDLPDSELPAVLSTSYGENEQSLPVKYTDSICNLFARLGARGMSIIFSSGDTGVGSACQSNDGKNTTRFNPIFPASCPFVTSVGGTVRVDPEMAIGFSSGGFSERFEQPSYQKNAVDHYLQNELPRGKWNGLYNPRGRGFPDVAAQGVNYSVVDHGKLVAVSGTSASAPTFAGIISILNSIRLAHNKPRLGFLNPLLYNIGSMGFNDIVHGGSNGCTGKDMYSGLPTPIVPYASWNATNGWDPVTGLGTPNFAKLSKLVLRSA